jgi:hypothetical protein
LQFGGSAKFLAAGFSTESRGILQNRDLECRSLAAAAFLSGSHDAIFGEAQYLLQKQNAGVFGQPLLLQ